MSAFLFFFYCHSRLLSIVTVFASIFRTAFVPREKSVALNVGKVMEKWDTLGHNETFLTT